MSKQTREERKAEEQRILAEMDEAMKVQADEGNAAEEASSGSEKKRWGLFEDKTPEKIHCRKCKTLMEDGVCPNCGFRIYKPMDERKLRTVRWILGGICIVGLIVLLIIQQTK